MALGSAHRLAPEATFLDPQPDDDRVAVEAAFERLAAYSPGLAGTSDPGDPAFGLIRVQLDGLERLWGPEAVIAQRLAEATATIVPGPPLAGIAGTSFAATVAAARAVGGEPCIVEEAGEAGFLAPLPAALLTDDPNVRARLARLGLCRIGQVAEIARSALVARFGVEGERIGARARGEQTERFVPRQAPERLVLGLPVEPPTADVEPLRFLLRRLAAALADHIGARGMAASRAHLRLEIEPAFARRGSALRWAASQRFPEPTADPEAIERLLLARLQRTPPKAAVERIELELASVEPATGTQLPLFVPQAARGSRFAWQLARLALAFGEDRVYRVGLADPEAPLADARARWEAIAVDGGADA
jgi:protein ImuB